MNHDPHSEEPVDQIEELLAGCLQRPESEWLDAVDELCVEHASLAASIRRRFELLKNLGFHLPGLEDTPEHGAFGEFRLLELLGRGGMGVVYRAVQTSLGRTVALKLVRSDYLAMPKAKLRFRREVEALSALDHPAICTIYEAGEVEGRPYLAMRYILGKNLAEHIAERKQRKMESGDSSHVADRNHQFVLLAQFEMIARAIHTAHEVGLVHRDIKPANIMITQEGEPVLLDFGLARSEVEDVTLTQSGDALGTPTYMAPEQIDSRGRDLDRRCDIYSLATSLYECVTHETPFQGATRDELYRAILTQATPDSRSANPKVSNDLATVLKKAMQRERDDRYSTALEFAEELRRIRNIEPIQTRAASLPLRLRRWAQRERLKAILAAVLIVATPAVAGLGGYLLAKSDVIETGEITQRHQRLETALAAGYYYRDIGQEEKSQEQFVVALEIDPSDHDAILGMRLVRGNTVPIEDEWSSDPADQFQLGLLADSRVPSAKTKDIAFEHYQRAVLLSGTPRLFQMIALGHAARRAGRLDDVRTCVATIRRHWPDDMYGQRAAARMAIEIEPELTVQLITDLLAKESTMAELYTIRAHAHEAAGRPEAAYADYERGAKASPTEIRVVQAFAQFLLRAGRHEEVVDVYEEAIAGGMVNLIAYGRLANVLTMLGRHEEARVNFDLVLQKEPLRPYDFCYVGDAYRTRKAYAEAEKAYLKGLALDPNIGMFQQRLAQIYRARRDILAYVRALKAMTKDSHVITRTDAHYNLSMYMTSRGQDTEAEQHLRTVLKLAPDHAEAHCNLASILVRRYRIAEALAHYEKGHELGQKRRGWKYNSASWIATTRAKLGDHKRYEDYSNGAQITLRDESDRVELAHYLLHHEHYRLAFEQFSILMAADGKASRALYDIQHAALAALGLGLGLDGSACDLGTEKLAEARKTGRHLLHRTLEGLSPDLKSKSRRRRSVVALRLMTTTNRPELKACRDSTRLSLLGAEEREEMRKVVEEFDAALPR